MYPKLIWNLVRIKNNCEVMLKKCQIKNLELIGVVKLCAGSLSVVETVVASGIKTIADSRLLNLKKFQNLPVKKMLLRIPMLSEVSELVKVAECTLVSEIKIINAINLEAQKNQKIFEIILMIETGDIREGLWGEEIISSTIKAILELSNVRLIGLGTNFACYGATIPTVEKLNALVNLKQKLEAQYNIIIPKISCGNSSHISIWDNPNLKQEINQIRSGTALLMGLGLNDEPIPFLKQNNLWLEAEIIEIQIKPSASIGERGLDAFGKTKEFNDIGNRIKAIIALGRQDCPFEEIIPFDNGIIILGQSSDHTILDITDYKGELSVGDILKFKTTYLANLSLSTSEYVKKEYIK